MDATTLDANNQALTLFNHSVANNQVLTAFNHSAANNQALTTGDFDNKVVGCELKALETHTVIIEEENNKLKRDTEQLDLRENKFNRQVVEALHRLRTLNHNPEANKYHSEIAALMDQLKGYK
ncbi:hypothetical protein P8452_23938 [Trifolium repens]|nr:hypothetical protein P8452_23938 [Trifolium repens]